MARDLRIVFMGTPEFAVASLHSLLMNGFNVVGVVTSPDRPAGRGRKISKPAVKEFAELRILPILQPENLKDISFLEKLEAMRPDLIIVVAFRMLPEAVWKMPSLGTFNLHASLLPNYRGAAPINHAIINGETITGVTTFLIDDRIDTGNILLRDEVPIYPFENAGDIHNKLMKSGARLVIKTVEGLVMNSLKPMPQSAFMKPGEILKTAPKIFPADCLIIWNNEPVVIHNLVRGLAPSPCARSSFRRDSSSLSFKIYESRPIQAMHDMAPGETVSDGKNFIRVACINGFLEILSLQLEGKRRMNADEFLKGFNIRDYKKAVS
jgi:methionyl-tRNA formyltransferase